MVSPVREYGALLARHSGDGQLLAVAVNQYNTHLNRLIFLSAYTDVIVATTNLKGMATKLPITGPLARCILDIEQIRVL